MSLMSCPLCRDELKIDSKKTIEEFVKQTPKAVRGLSAFMKTNVNIDVRKKEGALSDGRRHEFPRHEVASGLRE